MNIDITTLSVTELKAMAYDIFAGIEQGQNNLKLINQEIAKKSQPEAKVEPAEEVTE